MNPKVQNPPLAGSEARAFTTEVVATDSESLRKQLAEQTDLKLRLAADFENFKRLSRQESDSRAAAQKESLIHELLPIIDNLDRALASGASSGSPQLHQGMEMTLQQLRLLLRQHGIELEESVGQPFDPHRHEALSQRHDAAHPAHSIIEVLQRGYRRGDKVFRPAKVVVTVKANCRQITQMNGGDYLFFLKANQPLTLAKAQQLLPDKLPPSGPVAG
jgi:molecular chaperone GrpE